ncbi:cell division transmembrane protein FtsL [Legionella sainthelensi]|uniref:Cell division protein FtsL n=1 Tax=Legionella sainthelensi TaxID=28087 RepID=A0A0W0YHA5_9GAMM|nr:cell division protein FtsL [Legionella sainthelensi]AUH72120.1 cell division protein FtsL [Legionella sainthelensi]KTD55891.1 cell division transmembrane protein FtsL [Legionella sainthelensi]VEB34287.1 cell division transmembrane protein FtsL [Legionella sainthelensi]VEH29425.1 cell division transmembrane protein FtsL [Legionella sainthelensi]
MNAAAKVINQEGTLFNGQLADIHMSKSLYMLVILLIAVLISALAVVYSTNSYRVTLNQVEQQEQFTHYLQLQWGQLLLEQASLATPARVEELASDKLQMVLPTSKNTYWLQAQQ